MLRLTTRGAWVPGIWSKGHYEKASSSYYYDPELAGLRPSDEASIIKCDNYGYPRFLLWAIYNYMSEIKTYDNTHNTGYKLSKVAAKYAAMIINQILKQVPEGKGEADFIVKVPYRVGRDNVSGKVFYMDEKDFPAFANKVRQA